MKNIIEVIRLNDNHTRIYELPADLTEEIKPGRLVDVDFRAASTTTLALVKIGSRLVDDAEEALIRQYRHITGDFQKVRRIYPEAADVAWPADAEDDPVDDTDDTEAEDDE